MQGAITGITGLVQLPLFFSINADHVADVGNRVCTAFDQGQTFAQVKAIGLAQVAGLRTGLAGSRRLRSPHRRLAVLPGLRLQARLSLSRTGS